MLDPVRDIAEVISFLVANIFAVIIVCLFLIRCIHTVVWFNWDEMYGKLLGDEGLCLGGSWA